VYRVLLERRAEKELDTLEQLSRKRVVERILMLGKNPRQLHAKKLEGFKNAWRLRIGNFRVIYEIDDREKKVLVYRIRERGSAYKD